MADKDNKYLPEKPEFTMEDLKKISDANIEGAKTFLEHRYQWTMKDLDGAKTDSHIKTDKLTDIILNPGQDTVPVEEINLEELFKDKVSDFSNADTNDRQIRSYIKALERQKQEEIQKNIFLKKQKEPVAFTGYENSKVLASIDETEDFEEKLVRTDIVCALLITDTFYTRETAFYRKITKILNKNKIAFVEYTNVQPELDRKLIFRMAEFAHDHEVNCVIVIGSMSTVDISKILLPKLYNPNILKLHKSRSIEPSIASRYSIFSIPTVVVPESGCNSRSVVKNHILFPKLNFFGNVLFLKNEVDDSDGVFYCADMFEMFDQEKVTQILHETFFRLIFNYFDLSATDEKLDSIVFDIKKVEKMLDFVREGQQLNKKDHHVLLEIIAKTMESIYVVDVPDFWIWHKLEGSLSLLVNSKKSDGLALFLPTYVEVLAANNFDFNRRATKLGSSLYGSHSVDGFVYRLILHIKKHNLPLSLLDIPQVKKVDFKFLNELLKKASIGSYFNKLYKTIIKNITILSAS